jgi:hypothetical protein
MCELKTYGWKNAFFLLALFYLGTLAEASASEVTFEYAPPEWQTAICLPDDPHKSLVDHKGKLKKQHRRISNCSPLAFLLCKLLVKRIH